MMTSGQSFIRSPHRDTLYTTTLELQIPGKNRPFLLQSRIHWASIQLFYIVIGVLPLSMLAFVYVGIFWEELPGSVPSLRHIRLQSEQLPPVESHLLDAFQNVVPCKMDLLLPWHGL